MSEAKLSEEDISGKKRNRVLLIAFTSSIIITIIGVSLHIVGYTKLANKFGFYPKHPDMGTPTMGVGMAFVTLGTIASYIFTFCIAGVTPPPKNFKVTFTPRYLELLHNAKWTNEHSMLVFRLCLSVAIDMMKPATIGFTMPGLLKEYKMTKVQGSILPIVAIAGTVGGSLIWGFMADRLGRRPSMLLSTILFISTSICGAMPNFKMNLFMCFMMGLSVGGMIPVDISLLSEVVPSKTRSETLILVLSVGSAVGYLAAALANYVVQDQGVAWRVLWFVGLPSGLILLPFVAFIPESFRFLLISGRDVEACKSMEKYLGVSVTPDSLHRYLVREENGDGNNIIPKAELELPEAKRDLEGPGVEIAPAAVETNGAEQTKLVDEQGLDSCFRKWLSPAANLFLVKVALCLLSMAWGLCNYGFITYIPTMLTMYKKKNHLDPLHQSLLILYCSAFAVGAVPIYIFMYGKWSTKWATLVCAWMEVIVFIVFGQMSTKIVILHWHFAAWYCALLIASNGLLAMLIVYSAELFSTVNRGKGTGMVAAFTKVAGIWAPYIVTTILTAGSLYQLSIAVGVPLIIGAGLFTLFGSDVKSFEPDFYLARKK